MKEHSGCSRHCICSCDDPGLRGGQHLGQSWGPQRSWREPGPQRSWTESWQRRAQSSLAQQAAPQPAAQGFPAAACGQMLRCSPGTATAFRAVSQKGRFCDVATCAPRVFQGHLYTSFVGVENQPGSWCLAAGGRQVRSQVPCRVSWPQRGALAAAEVAAAVAQAVPGRWGPAGAEHLHNNRVKMEMLFSRSCQNYNPHIRPPARGHMKKYMKKLRALNQCL